MPDSTTDENATTVGTAPAATADITAGKTNANDAATTSLKPPNFPSGSDTEGDSDDNIEKTRSKEEDEDGSGNDDDDDDDEAQSTPDDLLLRAMTHKEDGNAHFKSNDYTSATRSYRKGTNLLKKLNSHNTGDDTQVKSLLITLQTNLSMVCHRQKKYKLSRDVASRALEVDAHNVKALYRRAVAHRALGDGDAARVDLRMALKADSNNVTVKKELVSLKKSMDDQKAREKAGLQRAFSSKKGGSSLLYSDKEEEEKRKAREADLKKKEEEEKVKRRKQEWEDECVRRMASDPPEEAISFEDWDKARKESEEAAEKARKKAKKEQEKKQDEERRKAREAQKAASKNKDDSDDDDDELTERELAMLRGYKKTSDGRTTSYFNREQTEHEKQLIGCIKPKKLEATGSTTTNNSTVPSPTSVSSGGGGTGASVGSVWNQSGTTWEERDTTDWAKKTFESCLRDATAAYYSQSAADATYVAMIKKVKDLTGDASVAIVGGKKRFIYDFHASLEYEIVDDNQNTVASGSLKLPDVNSATAVDEDEIEVEIFAWKKAPSANNDETNANIVQDAIECRNMLATDVRKSVLRFVEKFNSNF